jgi:uncharacterized membrane protein
MNFCLNIIFLPKRGNMIKQMELYFNLGLSRIPRTIRTPLLLGLAGTLLRIIPFWAMPTWYDENFTILVSRLPLPQLIAATAGDVHPPLWYLLIYPLVHIPGFPGWLAIRLPSLIFGIASLWVFWKVLMYFDFPGWRLPSDRFKLVAFGLFCLVPQQIYYSQEGRMYALLTLLVLVAWLCILQRHWVWLGIVTALMLWLHNYGMFYAAALWLAGLVYDRRTWKPLTASLAAAGISFIPWLFVLLNQMGAIGGSYWLVRFTLPSVLGDLEHMMFGTMLLAPDMVNVLVFYGVVTWVLIWSLRRKTLNLPAFILTFIPWGLAVLVSIVWHPVLLSRALIPSVAFLCLLLAEPIEYLGPRPILVMSVFLVPVLVVNIASVTLRSMWAANWVELDGNTISLIDNSWKPGDLLYYVDDGVYISGAAAWKNINNILQVQRCGPVLGGLSDSTEAAMGIKSGPFPDNYPGRVWVVSAETPLSPVCMDDYLRGKGLLNSQPIYCAQDNKLVRSCVYLVER